MAVSIWLLFSKFKYSLSFKYLLSHLTICNLLVLDGELAPPVTAAGNRSLGGARVILPAALSLLVLGALIAIVLLVRRNSK